MKKKIQVKKKKVNVLKILKLASKGVSQREIAKKMEVSRSCVYYWIHKSI